jgi:DNA-binding NarL/FixJ family response regulator
LTLENDNTKSGKLEGLLKIHFPNLSERDIKLCHYIFLGLRSTDIAFINSVEVQSVKTAKHRLKKKLNLSSDDTIKKFLEEFVGSTKKIKREDISFSTETNSIKQPEPSSASLHVDSKKAQL